MKKITIAFLLLLGTFSISSADIGVNLGVTGTIGVFHATAADNEGTDRQTDDATAAVGMSSIFLEKTIPGMPRIALGANWVTDPLSSETTESVHYDQTEASNTNTNVTNTVQVDFENLTSYYVSLLVTEKMYIKAGVATVDVVTNEALGTGSDYANTTMDASLVGLGFNHTFDNTMFVRLEGTYMSFDDVQLTATNNTDNKIELNQLEGLTGSISVGKAF